MYYGCFSNSAFVLAPRACGSFRDSVLEDSISYSPMVLLDESLAGFQSQMFGGLVSLVRVPRIGVPDVGHRSPARSSERSSRFVRSFPIVSHCTGYRVSHLHIKIDFTGL